MINSSRIVLFLGACLVFVMLGIANVAQAQQTNPPAVDNQNCTTFSDKITEMQKHDMDAKGGILSEIYVFIKNIAKTATQKLFTTFTNSNSYQYAVAAAMTLMITFYGVAFIIGVVQPSFQQLLVRLIKMFIIVTLISPDGWQFFNENIVRFFQDGTDDLIIGIQSIALGGVQPPANATPFWALDNIGKAIIQPDTIIAIVGAIGAAGPYGFTMGALMIWAFGLFFKMLLSVLRTYAISYVARAMILGVAPIFFVFLLFDRTKQLFLAWLNTLVNLALKPILMFTFISFFLVMIETATASMLNTELCWTEFRNVEGSTNKLAFWRYIDTKTKIAVTGDYTFEGSLECLIGADGADDKKKCKEFPVDIVGLLSFLILIYIANRFTSVVENIAAELSNAVASLDSSGRFEQFMRAQGEKSSGGGLFGNKQEGGVAPKPKGK